MPAGKFTGAGDREQLGTSPTAGRQLRLSQAGLVEAAWVIELFTGLCGLAQRLGLPRIDVC